MADYAMMAAQHRGLNLGKLGHDPKVETFKPVEPVIDDQQDRGPVETTGTTILAAAYGSTPENGGVVLAADCRTSSGVIVFNRTANKLTKLTDHIYCCRSGAAADTQSIAFRVAQYLRMQEVTLGGPCTVESAARLFQQMCYYNRFHISAGIIVAGWDPINGGSVYSVPLGGAKIKQPMAMGGSGSTFLYSVYDLRFQEGLGKEECRAELKKYVALAKARDGSSGGNQRSVVIDKNGIDFDMLRYQDSPFVLENDPRSAKMLKLLQGPSTTVKEMYADEEP
eukprot:TRINITY_DN120_c15_g1_i1.p1 TRINITY_DN120_c15_g1~~TRINITY_DN120_c15_g1_i1.p1  ORF type:complete len:281 (+),score=100.15 TRINITY_DN120_c15_g1_i1:77-919(+)